MKNKLTIITILLLVSSSVFEKNVVANEQTTEVQSRLTGSWFFVSYFNNRKGAKYDKPSSFGEDIPYLILFDNGEGKSIFGRSTIDGSTIGYNNITYELIDNEIKFSIDDHGKQIKSKIKYELEDNGNIKLFLDKNNSLILKRKLTP